MAERLKAPVSKTGMHYTCIAGSNPALSASARRDGSDADLRFWIGKCLGVQPPGEGQQAEVSGHYGDNGK